MGVDALSTDLYSAAVDILQCDYDSSGNLLYLGYSSPSQLTSASTWRIVKFTYNASNQLTSKLYASGTPEYRFIWDNRASYSYS